MTPLLLFLYLCAIAGGLLMIGIASLIVLMMFAMVLGWARQPAAPPRPENSVTVSE